MSMLNIIAFSGASYTGKTSICNFLENEFRRCGFVVINEHPAEVVTRGVMNIFDPLESNTVEFKMKDYYGATGREWVIRVIEDVLRIDDRLMLNRLMMDRVSYATRRVPEHIPVYLLVQSIGFSEELGHLRSLPDSKLVHFHMTRPNYDYLPTDSRKNLSLSADRITNLPWLESHWLAELQLKGMIA